MNRFILGLHCCINSTLLDGCTGWLVSVSNDAQNYTDSRLYIVYDDRCYDCTVSDDVAEMMAKTDDVTLAPALCTRKV